MSYLTLVGKVIARPSSQAIIPDAMRCATKVYNGLVWHLREEYEETGKSDINRAHLNRLTKNLPRANGYYSLSAQTTWDEVIQA